jgi:AcrR family transcriptional regulator
MDKNKTHQHIVEAAYKLFAEHGIEKTSLSMIASEVGISKPAIYYHFASKEALIDYLFEETFKDYNFASYFTLAEFNPTNFEALLITNGLRMLPHEDEELFVMRVLNEFLLLVSRKEKYYARIVGMQEDFLNGFTELLARGAELGLVSHEKITSKAHMLAMVIDNISNYMLMGFRLDYEDIWSTAVKSVLHEPRNGLDHSSRNELII